MNILGAGPALRRTTCHPYLGRNPVSSPDEERAALEILNRGRDNRRGPSVEVDYYFEVQNDARPLDGIRNAAKMLLEHGTLKPWHSEGDPRLKKPAHYDDNMSWATRIALLGYHGGEGVEAGIVTIAYPLAFFDKSANGFPLAQLLMAMASEPFSAFLFYQGARIADVRFPDALIARFPGRRWPHRRVREYLGIAADEPIIGTIVKPKTGLTPELFSKSVVEAARAGARFTKADENMHLRLEEVPVFVARTVQDLRAAGFDLGPAGAPAKGPRFLFAPHITAEPSELRAYAQAAVDAGANALMFSPYYGGGFQKLAEIAAAFDVPVYSHTAGMNVLSGALNWGIDPSVFYRLAAYHGAAFMQLTAVNGYLKPDDTEKAGILEKMRREGLEGPNGMTLVIAGGLGPRNIGANMRALGMEGRMFLAGTSVYSHPDGATSGVKAIILAYRAFQEKGIVEPEQLVEYAKTLGDHGLPLARALQQEGGC